MAKVQLKENLIAGGEFHWRDAIVDEEVIPQRLRTPELIKPPGGPLPESDWEEFPVDDEGIEESMEPPPPPPPRKR